MNVVITGSNRGLGLGFVRHYLSQGHTVWACCRHSSEALQTLSSDPVVSGRLHLIQWDIASDKPPLNLNSNLPWPEKVDILINNAGIYGPDKDGQSLRNITAQAMIDVFNVDCVGPIRVVQRLLDHLGQDSVVANVSSKMGSSSDNSSGGTYAYRAAKSGLVIVSKSMAVDLADQGIHVLTLHPGWVRTDMVNHTGLIDVRTSVQGMTEIIEQARDFPAGSFIAYDKKIIPY